jgi:hypothetical protein
MSNRRRLAREQIEYYLVYLILAYRGLILIVSLLSLALSIVTIFFNPFTGNAVLLLAIFLLLLSNSFNVVLYTARLGAWLSTLWMPDD